MPVFDYCSGENLKRHILKITTLQERAAKIILKPNRTPSNELFKALQWLSFENRCSYHAGVTVYKSLENNVPAYISELIQVSNNDRYMLRSSSRQSLEQIRCNTVIKKQSFQCFSIKVWNSIPLEIRSATSLNSFKYRYKNYLLSVQFN